MTGKKSWINSLKGLAICGVVMVHSGVLNLSFPLGRLGAGGAYGVYVFFVISAYLAYVSLEHFFCEKKISITNMLCWWQRKFVRLIPVFYLVLLITLLFANGNDYWLGSQEKVSIWNIISHALFLHGLFPHYANSIIGVEWYLGVLAIFYAIVPFIYKHVNSHKKAWVMFAVSFAGCEVINQIAFRILPQNIQDGYIYQSYVEALWIFEQVPSLCLGIVLYYFLKSSKVSRVKVYQLILVILCSCIFILGRAFGILQHSLLINYTLCAVCTMCIVLILNSHKCVVIDNLLWSTLGCYSYPIYLLHCFISSLYDKYINLDVGNVFLNWGIKYLIVIAVSLIVSVLVTRFFDEPIQKLCKNKMDGKK